MGDSTKIVLKAWLICVGLCVLHTYSLGQHKFSCFLSVFYIFQLKYLFYRLTILYRDHTTAILSTTTSVCSTSSHTSSHSHHSVSFSFYVRVLLLLLLFGSSLLVLDGARDFMKPSLQHQKDKYHLQLYNSDN